VDLVDLKTGLVLELLSEWSFPLCACERAEPTVAKAVHAFLIERRLDLVELCTGLLMDLS
jgi:hypothetical protein